MQVRGDHLGRHLVLLHVVKSAAVYRPEVAGELIAQAMRAVEVVLQEDEVERGPDPHDAGDHVRPTNGEVDPLHRVAIHGRAFNRNECEVAQAQGPEEELRDLSSGDGSGTHLFQIKAHACIQIVR